MAAAINKLKSDSRFVSVFADNTPDVDITFMIPFLQRPTDHYMVGVDNLTISLSALGLLEDTLTEPAPKDIILQVIAKRKVVLGNTFGPSLARPKGDFLITENDDMKFRTFRGSTILSLNEFMIQLDGFGSDVSAKIEKGLTAGVSATTYIFGYATGTNTVDGIVGGQNISKHLGFYLTPDGRLAIVGSKLFWANFIIWFPNKKYRRVVGIETEFLSLTAKDGQTYGNGSSAHAALRGEVIERNGADTEWTLKDGVAGVDDIVTLSTWDIGDENWQGQSHVWVAGNCLLSSLDRRISIELGASAHAEFADGGPQRGDPRLCAGSVDVSTDCRIRHLGRLHDSGPLRIDSDGPERPHGRHHAAGRKGPSTVPHTKAPGQAPDGPTAPVRTRTHV